MEQLTSADLELIELAKQTAHTFSGKIIMEKEISSLGAAARLPSGEIYTGANFKHPYSNPCSLDAEYVIAAQVYADGFTEIDTIATYYVGDRNLPTILYPCGQCQEMLRMFGDPWIIIEDNGERGKVKLHQFTNFLD